MKKNNKLVKGGPETIQYPTALEALQNCVQKGHVLISTIERNFAGKENKVFIEKIQKSGMNHYAIAGHNKQLHVASIVSIRFENSEDYLYKKI